jgi:hypothetical protein
MPAQTLCPRCGKTGLVRMERVIKAGEAMRAYYCGRCEHSWQVADDGSDGRLLGRIADGPPDRSRPAEANPKKPR